MADAIDLVEQLLAESEGIEGADDGALGGFVTGGCEEVPRGLLGGELVLGPGTAGEGSRHRRLQPLAEVTHTGRLAEDRLGTEVPFALLLNEPVGLAGAVHRLGQGQLAAASHVHAEDGDIGLDLFAVAEGGAFLGNVRDGRGAGAATLAGDPADQHPDVVGELPTEAAGGQHADDQRDDHEDAHQLR